MPVFYNSKTYASSTRTGSVVTGLVRKKVVIPVTPAKAGVQKLLNKLDSRLRGNDNVENGNDRKFGFSDFLRGRQ